MALDTIGSISTHLVENFTDIPAGVSGNMVEMVDMARQHVANYTGQIIGSNSINAEFQPAILDFAKADVIDLINAQAGGEKVSLAELSLEDSGEALSAQQYRMMAEFKLRSLGRAHTVVKSLS